MRTLPFPMREQQPGEWAKEGEEDLHTPTSVYTARLTVHTLTIKGQMHRHHQGGMLMVRMVFEGASQAHS